MTAPYVWLRSFSIYLPIFQTCVSPTPVDRENHSRVLDGLEINDRILVKKSQVAMTFMWKRQIYAKVSQNYAYKKRSIALRF